MKNKILIGILPIILIWMSGCISDNPVVCNEPYILVGDECCLDNNDNLICDGDETTTTIQKSMTSMEPTTTVITTTSTSMELTTTVITTTSTTSITIEPECYMNKDCGINGTRIVKNYTCYRGDLYRQSMEYICRHPGTADAKCIGKDIFEVIDTCGGIRFMCFEGETECLTWERYYLLSCGRIEDTLERDNCYIDAAKEVGRRSLCAGVNVTTKRDTCYYDIYKAEDDVSACKKIEDYDLAGKCLYNAAVDEMDIDLCDSILDLYWREKCYDKLWEYQD